MSVKVIGKHEKDSRACRDALALTLNEMMAEVASVLSPRLRFGYDDDKRNTRTLLPQ